MGDTPMQLAFIKTAFGRTQAIIFTTTEGDQGQRVVQHVKPGNKFWAWNSTPGGMITGVNFNYGTGFSWGDGAPTCPSTAAEANAILVELAELGPAPEDVLTFVQ